MGSWSSDQRSSENKVDGIFHLWMASKPRKAGTPSVAYLTVLSFTPCCSDTISPLRKRPGFLEHMQKRQAETQVVAVPTSTL